MKKLTKLLTVFAVLLLPLMLSAQNDGCTLRLIGCDSYGDGWNGGELTVVQGTDTLAVYNAPNTNTGGGGPSWDTLDIILTSSSPVNFYWSSGLWGSEVSLYIYNGFNQLAFDVNAPTDGLLFTLNAPCSPFCSHPLNLIANAGVDEIELSWTPGGAETTWLVSDGINEVSINDTFYTFSYLTPNTNYTLSVRALCDDGDTSTAAVISVRTLAGEPITEFPFHCSFEDSDTNSLWVLENGSETNQWVIDTAVSNGGSYSLYVSNDGGLTNAYTNNSTSDVMAYTTFQFAVGQYVLSFDWRAYAESCCDFLRAAIVPASAETTSGMSTFPEGSIELVDMLNNSNLWQTEQYMFNIDQAGVYKLVFLWHNDYSVGSNPPAAVDNVHLAMMLCPLVEGLRLESNSFDVAVLTWNNSAASSWSYEYGEPGFAPGTGVSGTTTDTSVVLADLDASTFYQFNVHSNCTEGSGETASVLFSTRGYTVTDLPYITGFEAEDDITWDFENDLTNAWAIGSAAGVTGNGLYISTDNGTTHGYNNHQRQVSYASRSFTITDTTYDLLVSFDWKGLGENSWDYMRAWFVPDTVILTADLLPDGTISPYSFASSTPEGWVALGGQLNLQTSWQHQSTVFHLSEEGNWKLVFMWVNDASGGSQPPAAIDNVHVSQLLCSLTTGLTIDSVNSTSVTLSWDDADVLGWNYEYDQAGFTVGNGNSGTTTDPTVTLTGLNPGTAYQFYVNSTCGDGDGDPVSISFITSGEAIEVLPYTTGFEQGNDQGWEFANGSTNAWCIGGAVSTAEGNANQSLYISNDGGTTNAYSTSPIQISYAYRNFNIVDVSYDYIVSFDWKAYGEGNYDYLRAWFVPSSATITADLLPDGTNASYNYATTVPDGWIDLGGKMNLSSNWQTSQTTFHFDIPGEYRLVFMWANDASVGSNPPAAIDNVIVMALTCPQPRNVALAYASADSLVVNWSSDISSFEVAYWPTDSGMSFMNTMVVNDTFAVIDQLAANTSYTVKIRSICGIDSSMHVMASFRTTCFGESIPWSEGFDNLTVTQANMIPCWSYIGGGYVATNANFSLSGNGLGFYPNGTNDAHILVLPPFQQPIGGLELSFFIRPESTSGYSGSFSIGYITDLNNPASFVETLRLESSTMTTTFTPYEAYFAGAPAGARMAMRHNVNSPSYYWFIDSLSVGPAPDCIHPLSLAVDGVTSNSISVSFIGQSASSFRLWISDGTNTDSVDITTTNHVFNNLSPLTQYTITVVTLCDGSTSTPVSTTATTAELSVSLPFSSGFEAGDDNNWVFINGTYTNAWTIGSATASDGSSSLYISNDGGASNTYTYSASSCSIYAYKSFLFDTGHYFVSFDWKAYGESTYDYMRVFLVPSTANITSASISYSGTPSGWIAVDGGSKLNLNGSWQSYEREIHINTMGAYRLLFFWRNDNSSGIQPPAAIDNLAISLNTCPRPTSIEVDSVTHNTVYLHWTDGNDNTTGTYIVSYNGISTTVTGTSYAATGLNSSSFYTFKVRTICSGNDTSSSISIIAATLCGDVALPYYENFDSYTPSYTAFPNCWTKLNQTGLYVSSIYVQDFYGVNDGNALHFNRHAIALTPRIPNPGNRIILSCALRAFDINESGTMHVGFTTDTIGLSDYQEIAEFQPITDVITYNDIYFDSASSIDTGYVVFMQDPGANELYDWWLDEVKIEDKGTCPRPNNLAATNATVNSVDLSWTDHSSASQWIIEYGPTGFTPGTGTMLLVSTNPYTITGLGASYHGEFYVRTLCGVGDTSSYQLAGSPFTTMQLPATLPYSYNFESPAEWNNWQAVSNVATNWYRGSAVAAGNSQQSMYVSANNGVTYKPYLYNGIVNATAYRDINFGTIDSSYTLTFKARVGGTVGGIFDGLVVMLADPTVPVASSSASVTTPWGGLNDVEILSLIRLDTTWQTYNVDIDTVSGIRRLVFFWFNQSTGNGYLSVQEESAAIDDITLGYSSCPRPLALETVTVAASTAVLQWQGPSSASYEVLYRPYSGSEDDEMSVMTNTNQVTLTGLESTTTYIVWVRKHCGQDTSSYSDSILFLTGFCDGGNAIYNYDPNSNASTSNYSPIGYAYYNYSYVQTIIDSAYMASLDGDVAAFGFKPVNTSSGGQFTNMTVYMANVSESDLSDGFILPDEQHLFVKVIDSANFNYNSTDIQFHNFDDAFTWDGHSNVLLAVNRENGSWESGGKFEAHRASSQKMRYAYNDYTPYDPETVEGGTASTTVGDIVLLSCNVGCTRPIALYANNVNNSEVTLNWSGSATSYEVSLKASNAATWSDGVVVNGAHSYVATDLIPHSIYQWRVRSLCDDGETSDWTQGSFITDSMPCFAPVDFVVISLGYTTATFDWQPAGNENMWNIHLWNTMLDTTYQVTAHPVLVGGLTPNTAYNASITAVCGNGDVESEETACYPFATSNCQRVSELTVTNVTAHTAMLTWNGHASTYEIEYGVGDFPQGLGTQVTVNGNSYTLTGLDNGTDYSVYVRAVCEAGVRSLWSDRATFTTTLQGIATTEGSQVTIHPNPASGSTALELSGIAGELTVSVVDMNGRIVMTETIQCDGDCTKRLDIDGLAQGAYFVRVTAPGLNMVKKLVVK